MTDDAADGFRSISDGCQAICQSRRTVIHIRVTRQFYLLPRRWEGNMETFFSFIGIVLMILGAIFGFGSGTLSEFSNLPEWFVLLSAGTSFVIGLLLFLMGLSLVMIGERQVGVVVEQVPMTEISIGHVGVVISFVGRPYEDVSGIDFKHGDLVNQGHKGVWVKPLYPGKHPLNTRMMQIIGDQNVRIIPDITVSGSSAGGSSLAEAMLGMLLRGQVNGNGNSAKE